MIHYLFSSLKRLKYKTMKKVYYLFGSAVLALVLLASADRFDGANYGFKNGTPALQSVSALAFGPDGILFIGDSKRATIFAVDTRDKDLVEKAKTVELKNVDRKIAAALGTSPENITIQDLAVNPLSKKLYCAVQGVEGTPVLLTIDGDNIQPVSLKDIPYSSVEIADAPAEDAKDQRGRSMRIWAISDMNYSDGQVMVSGLSNQEFSSTSEASHFPLIRNRTMHHWRYITRRTADTRRMHR